MNYSWSCKKKWKQTLKITDDHTSHRTLFCRTHFSASSHFVRRQKMNRRNLDVEQGKENYRNGKRKILLSYFIQIRCLVSMFLSFTFLYLLIYWMLKVECWWCDVFRCCWLSFHINFYGHWMNKTSSSSLFRNTECMHIIIYFFGSKWEHALKLEIDMVYSVLYDASEAFQILNFTFRLWVRALSIHQCDRFEIQEPTMKSTSNEKNWNINWWKTLLKTAYDLTVGLMLQMSMFYVSTIVW